MNRRDLLKRLAAVVAAVPVVGRLARLEPRVISTAGRVGKTVSHAKIGVTQRAYDRFGPSMKSHLMVLPDPSEMMDATYDAAYDMYELTYFRQEGTMGAKFRVLGHREAMDEDSLNRARYLSDQPSPVLPYNDFVRVFQCDT